MNDNTEQLRKRKSVGGFGMLVVVMLAVMIMVLLFTALAALVSMETRRAVGQEDSHAAFFVAEGEMNNQFIRLDSQPFPTPQTIDCSYTDAQAKVECDVRVVDVPEKLAEIEVVAQVGKAVRKVVGIYKPGSAAVGPSPGPSPAVVEFLGSSNAVTADSSTTVTVPAGSGYMVKNGGNLSIYSPVSINTSVTLVQRPHSYCGGGGTCWNWNNQASCQANSCSWVPPGTSAFRNQRLWRCVDSVCPDYEMHRGERVVVGVDPTDTNYPPKLKHYYVKAKNDDGSVYDQARIISGPNASGIVEYRGLLSTTPHGTYSTSTVKLKLIPKDFELTLSPSGILDDDGGFADRNNYLLLTHPSSSDQSELFTDAPYNNVRTRVNQKISQVQCAEDQSPDDTYNQLPKQRHITPPCGIQVTHNEGSLLEIVYEDSVIVLLGGVIEYSTPGGNSSFYYFEDTP